MPADRRSGPWSQALRALGDKRNPPEVAWVAALADVSEPAVEEVLAELADDLSIEQEIHRRHADGGREFYAQIRAPGELYALARLLHPKSIVETGVSSGVSSAHFLLGLRANRSGRLYSIDLPTRQSAPKLGESESPVCLPPGHETGWAVPESLRARWKLSLGPSEELLPAVAQDAAPIGLFLHDSKHTAAHLTFELETVRPSLAPGAAVLADNTSWTGKAFDRFADSLGVPILRRGKTDLVGLRYPSSAGPANGRARTPRSRTTR